MNSTAGTRHKNEKDKNGIRTVKVKLCIPFSRLVFTEDKLTR